MVNTKKRVMPSDATRIEIVAEVVKSKMTIAQMQAFVDATIDKVIKGEATELEENRAAVMATIIRDRKGSER